MTFIKILMGFVEILIGFIWILIGFIRIFIGFIQILIGFIRIFIGFITILVGFIEILIGFIRILMPSPAQPSKLPRLKILYDSPKILLQTPNPLKSNEVHENRIIFPIIKQQFHS